MAKSAQDTEAEKHAVGEWAARLVQPGMRLGLGSGTTSAYFIAALGRRLHRQPMPLTAVASSVASEALARQAGIHVVGLERGAPLDLAVDGADEIGPGLALIKGGGGALLREKVLAAAAREFIVIADSSKIVKVLGKFPLPVEVVSFAAPFVMDRLADLGATPVLRSAKPKHQGPLQTDQGNFIVDCVFGEILEPARLARAIREIPGVVEHGLFIDMTKRAVIADGDRINVLER